MDQSFNAGRKILLFIYLSLDGFFEGSNGDIQWFVWDKEMEEYAISLIRDIDTMLFGRKTYQTMESYWPNASPSENNQIIIDAMNNTPKVVVSKSLEKASWNNTKLIKQNVKEEITKLKQVPGKDIVIYGSSNLSSSLSEYGLIDEYRIVVNPVVLGNGERIFQNINNRVNFKLSETRTFSSGNVLLKYKKR